MDRITQGIRSASTPEVESVLLVLSFFFFGLLAGDFLLHSRALWLLLVFLLWPSGRGSFVAFS